MISGVMTSTGARRTTLSTGARSSGGAAGWLLDSAGLGRAVGPLVTAGIGVECHVHRPAESPHNAPSESRATRAAPLCARTCGCSLRSFCVHLPA